MNMVVALRLKQKRKERQNFDAFRKQITTPVTLPFAMPAAGRVHVSLDVETLTGTHVLSVGPRELGIAPSGADQIRSVSYFEAGQTLEVGVLPDGAVLTVYIEDAFGRTHKIGES